MSRDVDKSGGRLIIGGPPKANLLPPEVGVAAQGKVVRRNAGVIVILAVIVAIAAYAGAAVLAAGAQGSLEAANNRSTELIAKQAKYAEVKKVTLMLANAEAAKQVGMSTEIDWRAYLTEIQNSLPAGTAVTNVVAETATPLAAFNQPVVPLQGARIGELKFTATSQSLPDVATWLDALTTLPGYVDATPGSVQLTPTTSLYEVTITLHIDKNALLDRFDKKAADERDKSIKAMKDAKAEKDAAASGSPVATPSPAPAPGSTPSPTPTNSVGGK